MLPASLKEYSFDSDRAQLGIARILSALKGGQHLSRGEICSAVFKSKTSVSHYLLYLRGNEEEGWPRRIYIAGWRESGGRHVPLYAKGNSPDKAEPKRMTEKQRSAKRRAAIEADPVKYEEEKAKRRARHNSSRPRETSLSNRILRCLALNPGMKMAEIAQNLDADLRCTTTNLQRLRINGKVILKPAHGKNRAMCWYVSPSVSVSDVVKPMMVKRWIRPNVQPQGIFAALGI